MPARRLIVPAFLLLAAGLSPRTAAAQDAGVAYASPADEIAALQAQIGRGLTQLSSGCVVACPALASMERAAARLCALDPGPRCADARAKVRDAARRVQQACGECRDQGDLPPLRREDGEKNAEKQKLHVLEAPPQPALAEPSSADRPPAPPPPAPAEVASAPRRGGCASCTVAADDRDALGAGVAAALAAIAQVARRRRVSKRRGR